MVNSGVEPIENHAHHGLPVARCVFQSSDPALEAMSQPEAAENGCAEREAITLMRLVRNDDPIVGCR